MLDQIKLENLSVHREICSDTGMRVQDFLLSCTLFLDLHRACRNDDLNASVNYRRASKLLTQTLQQDTSRTLESAAENLAHALLTMGNAVKAVDMELSTADPNCCPELQSVTVRISRSWHTAYIGLGSNLGDRNAFMNQGVEALQNTPDCIVERCSSWMEAIPYGYTQQDNFLNGVAQVRTLLTPYELLDRIHEIEKGTNLERRIHWGPRTLDLDILFYDDQIIHEEDLCIPHVDMKNRVFVLVPMAEIAPYFHHPVYGITIQEMLENLNSRSAF